MLRSQHIRFFFSEMIMVRGKLSFAPATLNNSHSTYFLAQWWLQKHLKRQEGWQQFSYQNWYKMVVAVSQLSHDFNKCGGTRDAVSLFNDWSIDGDSMVLYELQKTGSFDLESGVQVRKLEREEQSLVTSKFGQHKAVMSDMHTDGQLASKMFAFNLRFDPNYEISFNPYSFRDMNKRTLNNDAMAALMADWYLHGTKKRVYFDELLPDGADVISGKTSVPNKTNYYLKMNQSRYNTGTKLSNVVGFYVEGIETNAPNLQGWRRILKKQQNNACGVLQFMQLKKGILFDFSNILRDKDNETTSGPVYPCSVKLKLKDNQNQYANIEITDPKKVQEFYEDLAGIHFVETEKVLPRSALQMEISYQFENEEKVRISGEEDQYYIFLSQGSTKNILKSQKYNISVPLSQDEYINEIPLTIYASKYGEVCNQEIQLKVDSSYDVDARGYTYNDYWNSSKAEPKFSYLNPKEALECLLKRSEEFKNKYASFSSINEHIYQNHYDAIVSQMNEVFNQKNADVIKEVKQGKEKFIVKGWKHDGQVFNIGFHGECGEFKSSMKVKFEDGKGNVTLRLNKQLTSLNNPLQPALDSLDVKASIYAQGTCSSSAAYVYGIFFQKQMNPPQTIDWMNHIGPELKRMALLYPSMQRIVDLYNFRGILMKSMARAFDVEDQNNSRYMPATREMSVKVHRNIRKWVYMPLFKNCDNAKPPKQRRLKTIEDFRLQKKELILMLKNAFTVELSTIPLYLSAYFSARDRYTAQTLRKIATEEMTHLFIVSNILNAIQQKSLFPNEQQVPFLDLKYIPTFPGKPPLILEAKDSELKQFLNFHIKPCTIQQLFKFICIEIPQEIELLNIKYEGNCETRKNIIEDLNCLLGKVKKQQRENPGFKLIGELYGEIIDMMWDLYDAEKYLKSPDAKMFTGDPRKQFTYFNLPDMAEVYDLRSALNQIRLIVLEGEGASIFTVDGRTNIESHFVRFMKIATACDIQVSTTSNQIFLVFKDNQDLKIIKQRSEQDLEKWTEANEKEVNKKIARQFSLSRGSTQKVKYPDSYAPSGFLRSYERVMEELSYIFNTDINSFKKEHVHEACSEEELGRKFQVFRTKRMDQSIAKMKQLSLFSQQIEHPKDGDAVFEKKYGSRPNYNLEDTFIPIYNPYKDDKTNKK